MKIAQEAFDIFDKSVDETAAYVRDCGKVSQELQKMLFSKGEIPDNCISLSHTLSDAAITKVCIEVLKKTPQKIEQVFCNKIVTF